MFSGAMLIGYSRFILGVHSANQILYGFLLGLWSIAMSIAFIQPRLEDLIARIKARQIPFGHQMRSFYIGASVTLAGLLITVLAVF